MASTPSVAVSPSVIAQAVEATVRTSCRIALCALERSPSELNRGRDSRIGFDLLEDCRRAEEAAGMALSDDLRERVVGRWWKAACRATRRPSVLGSASPAPCAGWHASKPRARSCRLRRGEIVVLVV